MEAFLVNYRILYLVHVTSYNRSIARILSHNLSAVWLGPPLAGRIYRSFQCLGYIMFSFTLNTLSST